MKNTKINLCDSCKQEFAICKSDKKEFGDGIGNDNVIECDGYNKKENTMKTKLIYIDVETTGLDCTIHGLTEVAAIIVVDGVEIGRKKFEINPYSIRNVAIDNKALEMTNKTPELLKTYKDSLEVIVDFMDFMTEVGDIDPSSYKNSFQIVGYNTSFDIGFIKAWFQEHSYKFSEFFSYKDVDVFALVKHMRLFGFIDCKNDKLGTLCKTFNIELDAHDAMNDILATRELYKELFIHLNGSFNTQESYQKINI